MNIAHSYPPNFKKIVEAFNLKRDNDRQPVFTYGTTLYNPSGAEIPQHLLTHEEVHSRQQGKTDAGAEAWWDKFIADPAFRLEQELEAYGFQYLYAKRHFASKHRAQLLHSLASDLSSPAYGSMLSYGEAASKIRNAANRIYESTVHKLPTRN